MSGLAVCIHLGTRFAATANTLHSPLVGDTNHNYRLLVRRFSHRIKTLPPHHFLFPNHKQVSQIQVVEEFRKLLADVKAERAAMQETLAVKLAHEQQLLAVTAAHEDLVRKEKLSADEETFEWKIRKWLATSSYTRGGLRK